MIVMIRDYYDALAVIIRCALG